MRKIVLTIATMLMLSVGAFAQEDPKVLYELSLAYAPVDTYGMYPWVGATKTINAEVRDSFRTYFYVGVQYYGFFVGGGSLTKALQTGADKEVVRVLPVGFNPFYNEYVFNAGYRIGQVEFKFEHRCGHEVKTWGDAFPVPQALGFNNASDVISLTLKNF